MEGVARPGDGQLCHDAIDRVNDCRNLERPSHWQSCYFVMMKLRQIVICSYSHGENDDSQGKVSFHHDEIVRMLEFAYSWSGNGFFVMRCLLAMREIAL